MSRFRDNDLPVVQNIEPNEVRMIMDMFAFLSGVENNGKIPGKVALKLFISLGLEVVEENLPAYLTLKDFLLFADSAAPSDSVEGHAKTLSCLISQNPDGSVGDIRAKNIVTFARSLQRPPPSVNEAELYISSLTEYDDCEDEVVVTPEVFQHHMVKAYDTMVIGDEDI